MNINKNTYSLNDIEIGDKVIFYRQGIEDFRLYWEVIDFPNNMIEIEINEMGYKDKILIDLENVEKVLKK